MRRQATCHDFAKARMQMKAWNRHYPIGTRVIMKLWGGGTIESKTTSAAFCMLASARVWVAAVEGFRGFDKPIHVESLKVVEGE